MRAKTISVRPISKGGGGPSEYLFGPKNARGEVRDPAPRLLFGNPDHFERCVRRSRSDYPYTSYMLSYKNEPNMPTSAVRQTIHAAYLQILRAGLAADRTVALGVDHGEDEHGALLRHVIDSAWPRFQPYFHPVDRHVFSDFQWLINRRYGLQAPENPAGQQILSLAGKRFDDSHIQALKDLRERVQQEEIAGRMNTHKQFLDLLVVQGYQPTVRRHPNASESDDDLRVWIEAKKNPKFSMLLKGPLCMSGYRRQAYLDKQARKLELYQSFSSNPQPLWDRFQMGLYIRRERTRKRFPKFVDDLDVDSSFGLENLHPDRHVLPISKAIAVGGFD